MTPLSYGIAFIGGLLTLLPACGPALLPAFFAYAFRQKERLFEAVLYFGLGFSALFIPFGLGARWVVDALIGSQQVLTVMIGTVLVVIGVLSLIGTGVPVWFSRPAGNSHTTPQSGFILGLLFGFTSSACSAPIFGGIVTLAVGQGSTVPALLLLLCFELGLLAPLLLLALMFERWHVGEWRWLKGTGVQFPIFGRRIRLYTTNIISGLLFMAIGLGFLFQRFNTATVRLFQGQYLQGLAYQANLSLVEFNVRHPGFGGILGIGIILLVMAFVLYIRFGTSKKRAKN